MKTMRTPDRIEKCIDDAIKEWDELTEPLRSLGFKVIGYDPAVLFGSASNSRQSIDISVSDLRIINYALNTKV